MSSSEGLKQYGVTRPISVSGPTEADQKRTFELEKLLLDAGLYESREETEKREAVLREIDEIINRSTSAIKDKVKWGLQNFKSLLIWRYGVEKD